jgi:hypothetical protein
MVLRSSLLVLVLAGTASADPKATTSNALPQPPFLTLQPITFADPPAPRPVSLRLEASRIAAEVFENSWRYPDVEPQLGISGGVWTIGHHYRPLTARSASLHGGSMAAVLVGEILLATGSPLAGVAAMATGATLDAAAADVDRDAEAVRSRR